MFGPPSDAGNPDQELAVCGTEDVRRSIQDFLALELRALNARMDAQKKVAEAQLNRGRNFCDQLSGLPIIECSSIPPGIAGCIPPDRVEASHSVSQL